ncbi:PP2C family protein-serine/threonine phosphatase [Deinococcus cellulosilyticus]|uniref:PPM-type phosphatase domain-containing protein n=1 Tax=Deinococcus cellulosilyticus (strain DSM 18568 / NBRC 106333 / KACC 11606 / 5516J-15) TaxID=1223518 RepID=A0A511NA17_DEIC1|nr:protein phosphatase 2C domain-containing protein [Deinococcus cellulosilyticus]GEM49366.1 hypothetical protein DC3_50010 [Deinococcus cellulosilyticus NBRC 106333 = KACC 11606]
MTDPRPQDGTDTREEDDTSSSGPATPSVTDATEQTPAVVAPEPHEMPDAPATPLVDTAEDLVTDVQTAEDSTTVIAPVNEEGLEPQDVLEEQTFDFESPHVDPELEKQIEEQVQSVHGAHEPGTEPEVPVTEPGQEVPEDLPPAPTETPDQDLPPAQDTPAIKDPEPEGEIRAQEEDGEENPAPEVHLPETLEPVPAIQVSFPVPQVEVPESPDQPLEATAADDFLEEEILPSTFEEPTLKLEETQQWGNVNFKVTDALARGWFKATSDSGQGLLVHMQPQALWGSLLAHRIAPRALYSGAEGVIFPDTPGEVLTFPRSFPEALGLIEALSQYLFSLFKQGYALIDLDPDGLVMTPEGLRLRFPPRLARLGEPVTTVYREGFTAPEVMSGLAATGKEGVYFLGALLYRLMTGELLPAEGASRTLLNTIQVSGVPQVLYQALQPASKRVNPEQWRSALNLLKIPPTVEWKVVARSTVGLNPDRPVNEDSYAYRTEQIYTHHLRQTLLIACVSDGMGGMEAGEVASQAAVGTFLKVAGTDNIEDAIWKCNQAVLDDMNGRDGGCTFSGIVARDSQVILGHVGDTRAYQFSGCVLKQISKDHSLVAALVASGMMTAEEAEQSPDRNKVLRSLGSLKQRQTDYVMQHTFTVAVGDRILLLSDGVWGEVGFDDLQGFMELPLEQAADRMIQASLASGAPDNATVLIAERIQ